MGSLMYEARGVVNGNIGYIRRDSKDRVLGRRK